MRRRLWRPRPRVHYMTSLLTGPCMGKPSGLQSQYKPSLVVTSYAPPPMAAPQLQTRHSIYSYRALPNNRTKLSDSTRDNG